MVDIVMLYVDMNDPSWRNDYNKYKELDDVHGGDSLGDERVREVFSLKYVLRAISENMKFVNNIFLVVQRESQVPNWVNRETVKVVLHEDFVPGEFLPTFNNHTVEMFLHKIPGLSEKFIIFNDDMIVLKSLSEGDLYDGSIPKDMMYRYNTSEISYHYNLIPCEYDEYPGTVKHPHLNNNILGFKYNELDYNPEFYYRPSHGFAPLNRDHVAEVYNQFTDFINSSCTTFRDDTNMYGYAYRICNFFKYHKLCNITTKFLTFKSPASSIDRWLNGDHQYDCVCVNDDDLNEVDFMIYRKTINDRLVKLFPRPSKYEKPQNVAICTTISKHNGSNLRKWVNYHLTLGIDTIIIYDMFGSDSTKKDLSNYILNKRVIYINSSKLSGRQKQRCYKMCYRKFSNRFSWMIFMDIDEFIRCRSPFKEYLNSGKFDTYQSIQLNRFDSVRGKIIGSNKVRSIVSCENKIVDFFGKRSNIGDHCTYAPNPARINIVADCDANMIPGNYEPNQSSNICYIERINPGSIQELIKEMSLPRLKNNEYSQRNLNDIENILKKYDDSVGLTDSDIKVICDKFPKYGITPESIRHLPSKTSEKIDYVFPYVDFNDPMWQREYNKYKYTDDEYLHGEPRYNNYDLLRFKLRSLEENMPWINNIYILVSSMSQVPKWLNTDKVKIVLHEEFIPKQFLPLFNSSAIEMFLGNIPGLEEKFIYSNDDFYIMNPVYPYMFYRGKYSLKSITERPVVPLNSVSENGILYKKNSWKLATGRDSDRDYIYVPQHCDVPMHKSTCLHFLHNHLGELYDSISKFREGNNMNQYLYTYYDVVRGKSISYDQTYYAAFISTETNRTQNLINRIKNNTVDFISIDFYDDVDDINIELVRTTLMEKFNKRSIYERW